MSDLDEKVIGRAFLFNVEGKFLQAPMEHYTKQTILLRFFHLQQKFDMLQLIVKRIKNEIKFLEPTKQNTKRFFNFLIDLEAYFYLLTSTLDILTKLTPHFYSEWKGKNRTRKYFSSQIKFFKENPMKDPEYTRYLNENMGWFEKVRKHRNELTHNGALNIFFSSNKLYFGTKRNKKKGITTEEVKTCIDETFQGFCKFLIYYNSHFGAKPLKISK